MTTRDAERAAELTRAVEQTRTSLDVLADSLRPVMAPIGEVIGEMGRVTATAMIAVRSYYWSLPPSVRRRFSRPTPWHYKRARVALRRAGRPVTTDAVRELARAVRQGMVRS